MNKRTVKDLHAGKLRHYIMDYSTTKTMKHPSTYEMRNNEGQIVMDNTPYYPVAVNPEYMRRILACMNYCTGMSTEELEKQNRLLGII